MEYAQRQGFQSFKLTFDEIQNIADIPVDHSFLIRKGAGGIGLSSRENIHKGSDRYV